jgi:hypothetical protein
VAYSRHERAAGADHEVSLGVSAPFSGREVGLVADPNRSGFGIVPASGGQPSKMFEISYACPEGASIQWSPTSDAIDFVATREGVSHVWHQPIKGGTPQPMTDFGAGVIFNFVWLPNGKDMAVARGSTTSLASYLPGRRPRLHPALTPSVPLKSFHTAGFLGTE